MTNPERKTKYFQPDATIEEEDLLKLPCQQAFALNTENLQVLFDEYICYDDKTSSPELATSITFNIDHNNDLNGSSVTIGPSRSAIMMHENKAAGTYLDSFYQYSNHVFTQHTARLNYRQQQEVSRIIEQLDTIKSSQDILPHYILLPYSNRLKKASELSIQQRRKLLRNDSINLNSTDRSTIKTHNERTTTQKLPTKESSWANLLLQNHHDVIYVLSLKGSFLYVSPSVEEILGYKMEEIIGRNIRDFCHPSDLTQVLREIRDSTSSVNNQAFDRQKLNFNNTVNPLTKGGVGQSGPRVDFLMRMKHKYKQYQWMESIGKLHLEGGKGQEVIISTARIRPLYILPVGITSKILNQPERGIIFKCSLNGIILSISTEKSKFFKENNLNCSWVGNHLKQFVNREALSPLLHALSSNKVTVISHLMSQGINSPVHSVVSTVIPPSFDGVTKSPFVFIYTNNTSTNLIQIVDSFRIPEANRATIQNGRDIISDHFLGERSMFPSKNLALELHLLKVENSRLLKSIQERLGAKKRKH